MWSSSASVTPGAGPLLDQVERGGHHAAGAGHGLDLGIGLADDHARRPEPVEQRVDLADTCSRGCAASMCVTTPWPR